MYILSRTKEIAIDGRLPKLEIPVEWPENQWFDFGPSRTDGFSLSILSLFDEGEDVKYIFYRKSGHRDWLFIAVSDRHYIAGEVIDFTYQTGGNVVKHYVYKRGLNVHS